MPSLRISHQCFLLSLILFIRIWFRVKHFTLWGAVIRKSRCYLSYDQIVNWCVKSFMLTIMKTYSIVFDISSTRGKLHDWHIQIVPLCESICSLSGLAVVLCSQLTPVSHFRLFLMTYNDKTLFHTCFGFMWNISLLTYDLIFRALFLYNTKAISPRDTDFSLER